MSQSPGDIAEDDAGKEVRIGIYIALALVPVLFLLPFLSSNELKPLDPELIEQMRTQ